jgi:hypothetical protein
MTRIVFRHGPLEVKLVKKGFLHLKDLYSGSLKIHKWRFSLALKSGNYCKNWDNPTW